MLVPAGQHNKFLMQSAAVATGNGTTAQTTSGADGAYTTLTAQVVGITTATITWEGTIDGTNWVAVQVTDLTTGGTSTTTTADAIVRVVVLGLMQVRARISAWTSGTITVTGVLAA